ncbi:MAG: hypothetical protein HY898_29390 [Deltaproteobacteria bacterium]|nr:hypothetical protein [Deltaproteobacteria bacterium]
MQREVTSAYDAIHSANRDLIRQLPEAGDLPTRLSISFAKLISASARGHGRDWAEVGDVDEAVEFVNAKLAFLRMRGVGPVESPAHHPSAAQWVDSRQGETVRPADLAMEDEAVTGVAVSERTIRRHVQDAGGRAVGKGVYLLPRQSGAEGQPGGDGNCDAKH